MPFYLVPSKNIHKRGHSDAHAQQRAAHKYAVLQDSVIHTQRTQRHPHTSHFGVPTPSIISLSNIPKHFPTHVNTRIHITYIYIYIYIYVYVYMHIYMHISCMIAFLSSSLWALEALHSRRSFAWFRLKEAVLICESVEEPVNFWSRLKCSDVQGNPRSGVVKAAAEMQTAKHFPSLLRGSKACLAATWQHSSLVLQNDLLRKDGIMYQHNGSRKFLREWVRNTTSILQHKYSIIQNILILIFATINIIE